MNVENSGQVRKTYKETSIARIFILAIIGLLVGFLLSLVLGVQFPKYILAVIVGILFAVLGYFWKVRAYEPMSLEDLTPFEWAIWIPVSIAITPFVSGTIAYYIYKRKNRYPVKWKKINIILVIGFIVNILFVYLFVM